MICTRIIIVRLLSLVLLILLFSPVRFTVVVPAIGVQSIVPKVSVSKFGMYVDFPSFKIVLCEEFNAQISAFSHVVDSESIGREIGT